MERKHCSDQVKLVDQAIEALMGLERQPGQVQAACLRETIERLNELRAAIMEGSRWTFRFARIDTAELIKLVANIILTLLSGDR